MSEEKTVKELIEKAIKMLPEFPSMAIDTAKINLNQALTQLDAKQKDITNIIEILVWVDTYAKGDFNKYETALRERIGALVGKKGRDGIYRKDLLNQALTQLDAEQKEKEGLIGLLKHLSLRDVET